MMGKHIFSLSDVHALKFLDVGPQLVNRLRSVLLSHYVLYLLALLAENRLQGRKMLISDFLENGILIRQQDHILPYRLLGSLLNTILRVIWLYNALIYRNCTSLNSEVLIQQSLIGLIHTEW